MNPGISPQIELFATLITEIRLSGLLSIPAPAAPKNASSAQKPVPNTDINLFQIDNDGNIIGGIIATTTTNDACQTAFKNDQASECKIDHFKLINI